MTNTECHGPSFSSPHPKSAGSIWGKLAQVLEMIKFSHSLFALPFALSAMLVAAGGMPPFRLFFWILVACVAARSMAMAFNRLVDRHYDARNPRTRDRALPAGLVGVGFTWVFIAVAGFVFLGASAMLNPLCFYLAPVAIVVLLGYSYCKRFTRNVHLVLGMALGIAPLGAWIAVRGSLENLPVLLGLGVMFWTAGFDIIYSCLDVDCDRREGLHSFPARIGIANALYVSRWLHVFAASCLGLFIFDMQLGIWSWMSFLLIALLLVIEHRLVRPNDLSRVGPAFFTLNAWVSVVFLAGCALDVIF